jgi:N-methylhydantoinase B
MAAEVDPISLQVIGGALHSIAEQMGNVLYRMSYSSIIRESQDLGAGLFDRDFNTLCESDSTPMHVGSLPGYLRGIAKSVPLDAWKPGDCVVHNHPYYGASHSPDIAIVKPVFFEDELVGFSANTAHQWTSAATPGLVIDIPDASPRACCPTGWAYNEGYGTKRQIHPRQYAGARPGDG